MHMNNDDVSSCSIWWCQTELSADSNPFSPCCDRALSDSNSQDYQRAVNNTVLLQQAMSLLQHSVLFGRLSVFSWRFSCSDCYRCRDRVHFCNTLFIRLTLSICLHFCRCSGLILGISYVRFLCIFHIAQRDCYTSNIDSRCRHTCTTCTVDPSTSLLTTA